jgi:hypothetical protein
VTKDDGSKELVKTRNILIATGSEVTPFPDIEVCLPISNLYNLDLHMYVCTNDLVPYTTAQQYRTPVIDSPLPGIFLIIMCIENSNKHTVADLPFLKMQLSGTYIGDDFFTVH